jgi:hypothetical protein
MAIRLDGIDLIVKEMPAITIELVSDSNPEIESRIEINQHWSNKDSSVWIHVSDVPKLIRALQEMKRNSKTKN